MTDLREAIARAIVSAGYNPATAPAIADAVLAILPDAEALVDALEFIAREGGQAESRIAADALANYRKGTGREG